MDSFMMNRAKDRERIRQAIHGEIDGQTASREACERLIISIYDLAVAETRGAMQSIRALDRILKAHEVPVTLTEYLEAVRIENQGISFS